MMTLKHPVGIVVIEYHVDTCHVQDHKNYMNLLVIWFHVTFGFIINFYNYRRLDLSPYIVGPKPVKTYNLYAISVCIIYVCL